MAKGERRLGRGLGALLGEYELEDEPRGPEHEVPIDRVRVNPFQPRRRFDDDSLDELAESIRRNGLLQPLVVRPAADGYEIVAGERRWRALKRLGHERAPIVVRELSDDQMLVLALVENLQRENLSPLEEAAGYRQLIEEFGLTQEEVGRQVGRDRSTIANTLRLLTLPDPVRELLEAGRLSAGHARAILGIEDEEDQAALARTVAEKGLSVRETERRVRIAREGDGGPRKTRSGRKEPSGAAARDPVVRRAELVLERALGTQVRVRATADETGEIRITFHDADDFARLLQIIVGEDAVRALAP